MIGAHTLQNNKNAMSILLSTLNARYAHTALGLRYLKANMGALQSRTELMEFVIGADVTLSLIHI